MLGVARCRVRSPLLCAGCALAAPPRLHKSWMKGNDKDYFPPKSKKPPIWGPDRPSGMPRAGDGRPRYAAGPAVPCEHQRPRRVATASMFAYCPPVEDAPLWPQDARACRHIAGVKRELQARPDKRRTSGVHCRRRQAPACHPLPDCSVTQVTRYRPSLHRAPTAAARVNQPHARAVACACSMHMAHARPAVGRGGRQSARPALSVCPSSSVEVVLQS